MSQVRGNLSIARTHAQAEATAAAAAGASIARAQVLAPDCSKVPELQEALGEASGQVNSLLTENASLQSTLAGADATVTALETKIESQTHSLNICGEEVNAVLDEKRALQLKADKNARKYHRLKFAVCALVAGIATFLAIKLGLIRLLACLGPYGLVGIAAVPALVFTALWFLL